MTCIVMSLLAGLSTTLGAGYVFLMPGGRVSPGHMAFALALAAGVMLSVTVLEFWIPMLFGGKPFAPVITYSGLGAAAFFVLSYFVPEPEVVDGVPHSHGGYPDPARAAPVHADHDLDQLESGNAPSVVGSVDSGEEGEQDDLTPRKVPQKKTNGHHKSDHATEIRRQRRLVFVLMASLTAHNFPEGFAVAISALQSNRLGIIVMIAIAMHNIPEGIAIAVPVFAASGSHQRALWMSFLSGMAEPLGASVALFFVHAIGGSLNESSMENLLCAVGGVMCAVALKELLPEAWRQGRPRIFFSGLTSGFILMWVTIKLGA